MDISEKYDKLKKYRERIQQNIRISQNQLSSSRPTRSHKETIKQSQGYRVLQNKREKEQRDDSLIVSKLKQSKSKPKIFPKAESENSRSFRISQTLRGEGQRQVKAKKQVFPHLPRPDLEEVSPSFGYENSPQTDEKTQRYFDKPMMIANANFRENVTKRYSPKFLNYEGKSSVPASTQEKQIQMLIRDNEELTAALQEKVRVITVLQSESATCKQIEDELALKFQKKYTSMLEDAQKARAQFEAEKGILISEIANLTKELNLKDRQYNERQSAFKENYQNQIKQCKEAYEEDVSRIKLTLQEKEEQVKTFFLKEEDLKSLVNCKIDTIEELEHVIRQQKKDYEQKIRQIHEDYGHQMLDMKGYFDEKLTQNKHRETEAQAKSNIMEQQHQNICSLKENLLREIDLEKKSNAEQTKVEIEKVISIKDSEHCMSNQKHMHQIGELKRQNAVLKTANQQKDKEIKELYEEISFTRKNYQSEIARRDEECRKLQVDLHQFSLKETEKLQRIKREMMQLEFCNENSVKVFYENQIAELQSITIDDKKTIQSLREKLEQAIIEKGQQSQKHYLELQSMNQSLLLLKRQQKAKEKVYVEQKQSVSEEKSLESENNCSQIEFYQKNSALKQSTIKKMEKIISAKDKQIQELEEKIVLIKKIHKSELSEAVDQYKAKIQSFEQQIECYCQQQKYLLEQGNKKAQELSLQKQFFSRQIREAKAKEKQELFIEVSRISEENLALKQSNEELKRQMKELLDEYSQYRKDYNQERIDQMLTQTLETQKKRICEQQNENHNAALEFYERQITKSLKPQIRDLQQLIQIKEQGLKQWEAKYNNLQTQYHRVAEGLHVASAQQQSLIAFSKHKQHLGGEKGLQFRAQQTD